MFNLKTFLELDSSNRVTHLEALDKKIRHFNTVANMYSALYKSASIEDRAVAAKSAQQSLLFSSYVDFPKALATILSGHLSDSNLLIRRSLESTHFGAFLRDKPEHGDLWFATFDHQEQKQFEKAYKQWAGRREDAASEISRLYQKMGIRHDTWHLANKLGPHPNSSSSLQHTSIEQSPDAIQFDLMFHETKSGPAGFANFMRQYLWLVNIHFHSVSWWINHSGLRFDLSAEELREWRDSKEHFDIELGSLAPELMRQAGFEPSSSSNPVKD